MEDAGTSEEDDDIDSQDSNTPIDHGHLARNCSIKIVTPAVKASVISPHFLPNKKFQVNSLESGNTTLAMMPIFCPFMNVVDRDQCPFRILTLQSV